MLSTRFRFGGEATGLDSDQCAQIGVGATKPFGFRCI